MQIEFTKKEFRRLLDMVYIGNWILNSTPAGTTALPIMTRFGIQALRPLPPEQDGRAGRALARGGRPVKAFSDGGIHEAIMDYEDTVFYEILAEELARRDMDYQPVSRENYDELVSRMDDYIAEFEAHGTDNISIPAWTKNEPHKSRRLAAFCDRRILCEEQTAK